jgi:hypothetical protein
MAFLTLITMNISSVPRKQRRNLKADGKFFATVCIKPVPSVAAIAIPPEVRFTGKLSLGPFEERLKSTFVYASSTTTLQRLLSTFIVEEQRVTVEERLQTHTYEVSPSRAMEGVIVLDVQQMPLKSHDDYLNVLRATVAKTPALLSHLKDHIVLMPADNPGQKYGTYLVHNAKEADRCWLQRIVPMLGPLHLALNGIEDAYQMYLPVWQPFWRAVDGRDLPEAPHAHRMHCVLEIALVGWREIRDVIVSKCRTVVDAEVDTLVWLLEEVLPTFLNVYANVQRSNKLAVYEEFVLRRARMTIPYRALLTHCADRGSSSSPGADATTSDCR